METREAPAEELIADEGKKSPFDRLSQKTALVLLLLVLPIQLAFSHAGYPGRGRAAAICAGMIFTSIWMRWDLKGRIWFWATIVLLIVAHVPLVFGVPWTDHSYPGVTLLPVGLLDLAVTYGTVKLIEMLVTVISHRKQIS